MCFLPLFSEICDRTEEKRKPCRGVDDGVDKRTVERDGELRRCGSGFVHYDCGDGCSLGAVFVKLDVRFVDDVADGELLCFRNAGKIRRAECVRKAERLQGVYERQYRSRR